MSKSKTVAFTGVLAFTLAGIVVCANDKPKVLPAAREDDRYVDTPRPAQVVEVIAPNYEPCCSMPIPAEQPAHPLAAVLVAPQCPGTCGHCPKCPIADEPVASTAAPILIGGVLPNPPGTFVSDLDIPIQPGSFQYSSHWTFQTPLAVPTPPVSYTFVALNPCGLIACSAPNRFLEGLAPASTLTQPCSPSCCGSFSYAIPPYQEPSATEIKQVAAVATAAYKVRMELIGEVTQLELVRGDDVALRVQCDKVDVQMPAGGIQAIGKVCVSAPGIDVRCNRLWIGWQNGDIAMEGQVRILCQTGQQRTEMSAESVNCRLNSVGTGLDFAPHESSKPIPPELR